MLSCGADTSLVDFTPEKSFDRGAGGGDSKQQQHSVICVEGKQQRIFTNQYYTNLQDMRGERLPPMLPRGTAHPRARAKGAPQSRAHTSRRAHRKNVFSWNGLEVN